MSANTLNVLLTFFAFAIDVGLVGTAFFVLLSRVRQGLMPKGRAMLAFVALALLTLFLPALFFAALVVLESLTPAAFVPEAVGLVLFALGFVGLVVSAIGALAFAIALAFTVPPHRPPPPADD
jgi:hypothetical protein